MATNSCEETIEPLHPFRREIGSVLWLDFYTLRSFLPKPPFAPFHSELYEKENIYGKIDKYAIITRTCEKLDQYRPLERFGELLRALRRIYHELEKDQVNLYIPTYGILCYSQGLRLLPTKYTSFTQKEKRLVPRTTPLFNKAPGPTISALTYRFPALYSYRNFISYISTGPTLYSTWDVYFLLISFLVKPDYYQAFFQLSTGEQLWQKLWPEPHEMKKRLHNTRASSENPESIFYLLRDVELWQILPY